MTAGEFEPPGVSGGVHSEESELFSRVERFSIGVFGFSFTLLGGNFVVSDAANDTDILETLFGLTPTAIAFVVAVFIVGLYWWEHYLLFQYVRGIDLVFVTLNFLYLGCLILVPFTSEAVGQFPGDPWAWVLFAVVLSLLASVWTTMLLYARRRGLTQQAVDTRIEALRGVLMAAVFVVSIPLAFVLVQWTPVVWALSFVFDWLFLRYAER